VRQTWQQRHRLRKRAPKNGCRDIGRPFPALCALFVGNFPAVNPVCMTASRRMLLGSPEGRPEGPEISLPGPFPFGATETPLFGHLLTTPVAGRSCSNRWTRRGAPYCLRFAAAGLVGVDEVERLACGSTLRTVLIGTAPRQRFQQHACDIHASGTFTSDQPLVAHSWLDAHDLVHPGVAPGARHAGLRARLRHSYVGLSGEPDTMTTVKSG
jgi:hypothetical protein